ncbi:hypothetical protein BDQ17DRAFT_1392654 [Cyathus striatus]|nr:hypothetical protein BDQ17DRAFT_1392654 [Cyathus striatus]
MSYYTGERKQYHSGFRGGRGRGRGGSTFSSGSVASPIEQDKDIMEGLFNSPLQTIVRPEEQVASDITTANLKYIEITPLQWIHIISIRGSPPEWQYRATPYTVQPDNSFRSPSSSLLPLFTAVEALAQEDEDTSVNWPEIDFIMRWIGNADREFRIDMQLAGAKTVLLSRWEKRTRERFPGFTFGFNFEKASTKPASGYSAEGTGYHRIVTYDMGGLKMAVRFEVDACLPDQKKFTPKAPTNVDDLINSLAAVNISAEKLPAAKDVDKDEKSASTDCGALLPRSRPFVGAPKPSASILFLSQTPHHFMGIHWQGRFIQVNYRAANSQELKKKLVRALKIIQEIVKKHGERGRLSLVYQNGELKLYERMSSDGFIPDDVMNLFE